MKDIALTQSHLTYTLPSIPTHVSVPHPHTPIGLRFCRGSGGCSSSSVSVLANFDGFRGGGVSSCLRLVRGSTACTYAFKKKKHGYMEN